MGVAYDHLAPGSSDFVGIGALVEEHFEPVLPAGTEFDGIPTPSLNLKPTAHPGPGDEVKFMEALAHMQDHSSPMPQDSATDSFTHAEIHAMQGATIDNAIPTTVETGDVVESVTDMQATVIEGCYAIEELSDDGGVRIPDVDDGLEVTTDRGETPAIALDYTVEEAATEGRRTEVSLTKTSSG